jgi:hypothetical protein
MFGRKRNKDKKTDKVEFPDILKDEDINHRNSEFYNAFFSLTKDSITDDNSIYIINIYKTTKLPEMRNKSLKLLYDKDYDYLKEFFEAAYKRERYLDMKMLALRGLSQFITEDNIKDILVKFNKILKKRPDNTPYNYQEYELLRGQNSLPYLVKRYNYKCYAETLEIVEKQYNDMPKAFKGHFTVDENGEIVLLRSSEKSSKIMDKFFKKQGMR